MTDRKTIVRRLLRGPAAGGAASAMALGLMLAIGPTAAFSETKVRRVWFEWEKLENVCR